MKRNLSPDHEAESSRVQKRRRSETGSPSPGPSSSSGSEAVVGRRYQYEPLTRQRQIRLLKLHLNDSKRLCGQFTIRDLDHDSHEYTAISYCWGEAVDGGKLWFDDGHYLDLGEAANDILRKWATRSPKEYVWIDAVCLNQRDDVEKSQQVQYMREIYQKAESVMISLPTKYHGWGAHALKYVDFVSSLIRRTPATGSTVGRSAREAVLKTEMIRWCSKNAGLNALARIVDTSPYLSRTWIIQEIVSSSFAEIDCDGASMRWRDFAQAVLLSRKFDLFNRFKSQRKTPLSERFMPNLDAVSFIERLRRRKGHGKALHLWDLLLDARYAQVTQPLDKVFALRGLTADKAADEIVVDYTTSTRELYTQVTRLLLMQKGGERVLRRAGIWRHAGGDDLPSWAVDFRPIQLQSIIKENGRPSNVDGEQLSVTLLDHDRLQARGCIVDQIISTLGPAEPAQKAIMAGKIRSWYHSSRASTPASTQDTATPSSSAQQTTSRATILSTTQDEQTLYAESVAQLKALANKSASSTMSHATKIGQTACLHHLASFISSGISSGLSRKLVVTESDHIGLAPSIVKDGDLVVVFRGVRMPFVLRKTERVGDAVGDSSEGDRGEASKMDEERDSAYTLIGEIFVPGLMDGEAKDFGEENDVVLV